MSFFRCPTDSLSTYCEFLQLGCLPWKASWMEKTPAALKVERGQSVCDTGNGNRAQGLWRERGSQRDTLSCQHFSTSRPLVIFKASSCHSERETALPHPHVSRMSIPNKTLSDHVSGASEIHEEQNAGTS